MMRKFYTVILLFLSVWALSIAQNDGHFSMRFDDKQILEKGVESRFCEWFSLGEGVSFQKFRDTIDDIGYRHQSFQQLLYGTPIEYAMIVVHSKEGYITSMNGFIMEQQKQVERGLLQKPRMFINGADTAEFMVISIEKDDEIIFRPAYKHFDMANNADVYIDTETGDTLKKVARVHSGDVIGTGKTLYRGYKQMTVYYDNAVYYSFDSARNIATLYAGYNSPFIDDENDINNFTNESLVDSLARWFGASLYFAGSTLPFENDNKIEAVLIYDLSWNSVTDWTPDLYIKMFDSNENLLYQSSYYIERKPTYDDPVAFSLDSVFVPDDGFIIKIYDYNSISDDEFIGGIRFNTPILGPSIWQFDHSTGVVILSNDVNEGNDVHWGMQKTYDYWKNTFNRISFDNAGKYIVSLVDCPKDAMIFNTMPNNAFYSHSMADAFCFGGGDMIMMNPLVSLDVVAHEFTHAVTQYSVGNNQGLQYLGESGALNESFSDMFATCVDFYTDATQANWLIGEEVYTEYSGIEAMRDMANTKRFSQPDTYQGEHWASTSSNASDNGGVHTNSGVGNRWFYLLCQGGRGTNDLQNNYAVQGIGIAQAQRIAYRLLTTYLTPTSNFHQARQGAINAAIDLYGRNSIQHQSVENAWYAVGVGNAYIPTEVGTVSAETINMRVENRTIIIETADMKGLLQIYDMQGKLVLSKQVETNETIACNVVHQGVYMARLGDKTGKIVIW